MTSKPDGIPCRYALKSLWAGMASHAGPAACEPERGGDDGVHTFRRGLAIGRAGLRAGISLWGVPLASCQEAIDSVDGGRITRSLDRDSHIPPFFVHFRRTSPRSAGSGRLKCEQISSASVSAGPTCRSRLSRARRSSVAAGWQTGGGRFTYACARIRRRSRDV